LASPEAYNLIVLLTSARSFFTALWSLGVDDEKKKHPLGAVHFQ